MPSMPNGSLGCLNVGTYVNRGPVCPCVRMFPKSVSRYVVCPTCPGESACVPLCTSQASTCAHLSQREGKEQRPPPRLRK